MALQMNSETGPLCLVPKSQILFRGRQRRGRSFYLSRVAIIFLSLFETICFGGGHDLPPLDTDAQKLAFLLEVKKEIPALFSDAAQYDIDLFTLLDNEDELVKKLNKHPEYEELFSQKKYFDLTITPPKEGILVGSVEINPEAIEAWKQDLLKTLNDLRGTNIHAPKYLVQSANGIFQDICRLNFYATSFSSFFLGFNSTSTI